MDRRQFLRTLGLGAGALAGIPLLQACGQGTPPASKPADSSAGAAPKAGEAAKPAGVATPAAGSQPAAQAPAAAAGAPKRGGTLNVVIQNDWVTLDPPYNTGEPNGFNMIYDEWVHWELDDKGQWTPRPELLTEWDLKPDSITFKLQRGATFHDGTPWDAAAAKWNLDRMIFDPSSGVRAYWNVVDTSAEDQATLEEAKAKAATAWDYTSKAVEAVGDDTVRIRLTKPMAGALSAPLNSYPVSPTAFKRQGKAEYGRNPVGAGPFRFVEWKSGSHVILERNPEYWKKGADGQLLPYVDKLHYRLIIDDSVRLLELKSGTAHFTELVQGKDIAGVKADPNLTIVESQSSGNNYRMIFDSTNTDSPFQKHPELRQAMLYAMDREQMAKTLGFGSGFGRKYLLPKGSFAYDDAEQTPHYWFDKARAEQLVQGVLAKDPSTGTGGKVAVTLSVIDRAVDKMQSEMIKQMGDAVGFNVTLESMERAAWTAKLVKRPGQPGGKFDFATMRNPVTPEEPDAQWRNFYHSQGGFNVAHIEDREWDTLLDAGTATYDFEQRKRTYFELEKKAFEGAWYGYLWQQNWNWAFAKKMQSFKEPITNRWSFSDVWMS